VGARTQTSENTTFDRRLTLEAVDAAAWSGARQMKRLWQVEVVSTGADDDLRAALPYMLRAAQPYLGRSSGRQLVVNLKKKDASVDAIRGGPPPGS